MTWRIYRELRKSVSVAKAASKAAPNIVFLWWTMKKVFGIQLRMRKNVWNAVNA